MQKPLAHDEYIVRMEQIGKTFNPGSVNEKTIFDGFNLNIRAGEFVSVVGSNGSGKTTLLNLLCGSITADTGHILFKGKDISKLHEHQRAKFIGRVFQDPSKGTCAALTIFENMEVYIMCIIKGERGSNLCKRLHELHEREIFLYKVGDIYLFGYVDPKNGLLFVPFGDFMEVYGDGEYEP